MAVFGITSKANHVSADVMRKPFDIQNSTDSHVTKELMKDKFTADTLGGTTFYAAQIIDVVDDDVNTDSMLKSLYGVTGKAESIPIKKYRVYIPELHIGLGKIPNLPSSGANFKDTPLADVKQIVLDAEKAKSYPLVTLFHPNDTSTTYTINDAVWVMFQNSRTLENGFLFSKILNGGTNTPGLINDKYAIQVGKSETVPVSPYSMQSDVTKGTAKAPPGFNGKWLVDYNRIVELMTSSKGWPYRSAYYPSANEDGSDNNKAVKRMTYRLFVPEFSGQAYSDYSFAHPNANEINPAQNRAWEYGLLGVDCIGFVRRALLRLGFIKQDFYLKWDNNNVLTLGNNKELVIPLKPGDQLPGDMCLFGKNASAGGYLPDTYQHIGLVVSYPDPSSRESLIWASNGPGGICDATIPWTGVGTTVSYRNDCQGIDKFNPDDDKALFRPIFPSYFTSMKRWYFRVKNTVLVDNIKNQTHGVKDITWVDKGAEGNWYYEGAEEAYKKLVNTTPFGGPLQYKVATSVSTYPDVVQRAPDLWKQNRQNLLQAIKRYRQERDDTNIIGKKGFFTMCA